MPTPGELFNPVAWYDLAAESHTPDSVITTLTDQSGNGHTMSQSGGGGALFREDQFGAGLHAAQFTSDGYRATGVASAGDHTIIAVVQSNVAAPGDFSGFCFYSGTGAGSQNSSIGQRTSGVFWFGGFGRTGENGSLAANGLQTILTKQVWANTDGPFNQRGWYSAFGAAETWTASGYSLTGNDIGLGGHYYNGSTVSVLHPNFYLCEILFYDKALTYAERSSVESYLATKWGISHVDVYGGNDLQDIHIDDFENGTLNQAPTGWTDKSEGTATALVRSGQSGRYLEIDGDAGTESKPWAFDAPGTPSSNVEIAYRAFFPASSTTKFATGFVHGANTLSNLLGYAAYQRADSASWGILEYVAGNDVVLSGNTSTAFYTGGTTPYIARFRVLTNGLKFLKLWDADLEEPDEWIRVAKDTTLASGWVGLAAHGVDSLANFDWITVAVNDTKTLVIPELSLSVVSGNTSVVVTTGAFQSFDGGTHTKSQWQIQVAGGDWSSPIQSTGDSNDLLVHTFSGLTTDQDLEVRVRHKTSNGNYTSWTSSLAYTFPVITDYSDVGTILAQYIAADQEAEQGSLSDQQAIDYHDSSGANRDMVLVQSRPLYDEDDGAGNPTVVFTTDGLGSGGLNSALGSTSGGRTFSVFMVARPTASGGTPYLSARDFGAFVRIDMSIRDAGGGDWQTRFNAENDSQADKIVSHTFPAPAEGPAMGMVTLSNSPYRTRAYGDYGDGSFVEVSGGTILTAYGSTQMGRNVTPSGTNYWWDGDSYDLVVYSGELTPRDFLSLRQLTQSKYILAPPVWIEPDNPSDRADDSFLLEWTDVEDADDYDVEYWDGSAWQPVFTRLAITSFLWDTSALPEGSVDIRIRSNQGEGGGGSGGPAAWLEEDFSTYTDLADFLTDPRGIYDPTHYKNSGQMSFIAESPPEVGSDKALRYTFPARTSQVQDFSISCALNFPTPTRADVWYEIWTRFSSNFRTGAPNKAYCKVSNVSGTFIDGERIVFSGGADVPLRTHRVALGDMIYRADATPRPEFGETITGQTSGATATVASSNYVAVPGPNPDYKKIFKRVDSKAGSDSLPTGRFSYLSGNAGSNHMLGHPELADEPSFGGAWQYWDGLWHRYRFRTRCNTNVDVPAGTYIAWIDDTELHDFGVIDVDRRTYGISLGENMNIGTDDEITIDWGAVRIYNTDPGWGF